MRGKGAGACGVNVARNPGKPGSVGRGGPALMMQPKCTACDNIRCPQYGKDVFPLMYCERMTKDKHETEQKAAR